MSEAPHTPSTSRVLPSPFVPPPGPCALVVFGASGDLAKRKLLPALYHMAQEGHLPSSFALVGFSRSALDTAAYRAKVAEDLKAHAGGAPDLAALSWLTERCHYVRGDYSDPEAYRRLMTTLAHVETTHQTGGGVLFYLATLPDVFASVAERLKEAGLTHEAPGRWRRVVVEKPFGRDLDSARELNRRLRSVLGEDQIYRIDHYLGKETVQNILAFRFSNATFEPIWDKRYIDHVAITVAEELGVERRGPFYETTGALRDMVPNHLLQLLALTAMEPPTSLEAEAIREAKAQVLQAIHRMTPEEARHNTARGQYGPGVVRGKEVVGYRSETDVAPDSRAETFAALKLTVDQPRWEGVPFYLRTGKRLARRVTEVAIQFRCPPTCLFGRPGEARSSPNTLIIEIQPVEGIRFSFLAKAPGPGYHLGPVSMDFNYCDRFSCKLNTGYETLLYDAMIGDMTQFQRQDMTEAGWAVVGPILEAWNADAPGDFPNYAAGSSGPAAAEALMTRDGRAWRPL